MTTIKTLCVYCGSQNGIDPDFIEGAASVGKILAKNDVRLVYGGGTAGVMGAIARAVSENGGHVTGVIPEFLLASEAAHEPERWCSDVVVTHTMHERKQKMFELSGGFLAMPGGIGTLEELVEIMTWAQLGRHSKPIGVLNINGFWEPLMALYKHMQDCGFVHSAKRITLQKINQPDEMNSLLGDLA